MLMIYTLIGLIASCNVFVNAKFFSASIARERLVSDLFVNYNPAVRPASKGERIDVDVNIELQHFDFRESDGAFNIVGFLNAVSTLGKIAVDFEWTDKKLTWNPNDYNNLTQIPISQKLVWIPDLEMYNNAPDRFLRMHRNGYVVLNNTGRITWSDAIELTIFCSTNMHHWPKDEHICHLTLGSWTYDGFELDILNNPHTSLSFDEEHIKNMQFEITKYSASHISVNYEGFEEPYVTMKYVIEFQRRPGYGTIFHAPILPVILLTLLALALKPNRGEKILLNGINLFVIIFQLLYFAESVGKFARGTPLIVIFYSWSLIITTFAHLLCVFSLWASRSNYKCKSLPARISNFLNGRIASYIISTQYTNSKAENFDSQFEDVKLNDCSSLIPTENNSNDWLMFAIFLERVAIIFFSLIYLLLATICLA